MKIKRKRPSEIKKDFVIEHSLKRVVLSASSLLELKSRACKYFLVPPENSILVLQDGTEIDDEDFFQTRRNLTVVILTQQGEDVTYLSSHAQEVAAKLCHLLSQEQHSFVKEVKTFLASHLFRDSNLVKYQNWEEFRIMNFGLHDSKDDDPEWFKGLNESKHSKKEVMRQSCQSRIKGYYYKSKDEFRQDLNPAIQLLFEEMWIDLQNHKHNGHLFVRGEPKACCNNNGTFVCQGPFDEAWCSDSHQTNPYASSHQRVMFGTWNLDHKIERTRSVIPAIREASTSLPNGKKLNSDYFYSLLFTMDNLKLVHLVCHHKGRHLGKECDKKKYFVQAGSSSSKRLKM